MAPVNRYDVLRRLSARIEADIARLQRFDDMAPLLGQLRLTVKHMSDYVDLSNRTVGAVTRRRRAAAE